jgi:glycosyltransferase involved in cell wall biosynthesis
MKILEISQYYRKNDSASVIIDTMTNELRRRGHYVVIATPDPLCKDAESISIFYPFSIKLSFVNSTFGRFLASNLSYLILFQKILSRKDNIQAIIAHHHNYHPATFTAFIVSRIFKVPFFVFIHDVLTYSDRASEISQISDRALFELNCILLNKASRLFVQSETIKKMFEFKNAVVLPNCIEVDSFLQMPNAQDIIILRRHLNLEGKKILLFLGTAYEDRGLTLLVRAVRNLSSNGHNVVVLFVGRAPEKDKIIKLASDLKVEKNISFVGVIPHQEVPLYIALSDIAIGPLAPPPTPYTLPTKILEYMALGKPTIALKGSVPNELIINGFNGLLLKSVDEIELTNLIHYLLKNPDKANTMGKNAYKSVLMNYDAKVVINQLLINLKFYN